MSGSLNSHDSFLLRPTAARASKRHARVSTEGTGDGRIGLRLAHDVDEVVTPYSTILMEAQVRNTEYFSTFGFGRFQQDSEECNEGSLVPRHSPRRDAPLAEGDTPVEPRARFVSRRSVSASSTTPSFERSVALKEKRRAESVSSGSDGRSDIEWSGGNPGHSLAPDLSIEWPAPDQRHLRLCTKRRRRRRSGRTGEKVLLGSFKLPEEPVRLTGFKEPRRPTAPDTPPSPETPIYLCKDGFDEMECIPGGKSVFVPRHRHREISGLGALSFGKPASAPSRKLAQLSSPVSVKSHVSATSASSGEVGLFGAGSRCGFSVEPPESTTLGDGTFPPDVRGIDGVSKVGMQHALLARLDGVEQEAKVLVRQTPEATGCDLRTPLCVPENPSVPETPARNRIFYASSSSGITGVVDDEDTDPRVNYTIGQSADNPVRRNTTRGQRIAGLSGRPIQFSSRERSRGGR